MPWLGSVHHQDPFSASARPILGHACEHKIDEALTICGGDVQVSVLCPKVVYEDPVQRLQQQRTLQECF